VTSLSGRELAAEIRAEAAVRAATLTADGPPPRLAVVTATTDEASAWYVRSIAAAAARAGIICDVDTQETIAGITATLELLSADVAVHGIILQTPLPGGARLADLAEAIAPAKDIDGANPESLGRLVARLPAFAPATAEAVLALLDYYEVKIAGRRAVVVGRSVVVGKPVAHLLLDRDATVTICHSRTPDLPAITTQADILVAAAGRAGLIQPGHVAPGATVIDVGTNATPGGGLAGDVDPAVAEVAGALSPVPGGVGPVTTALLLRHVTEAAEAAVVTALSDHAAVDGDQRGLLLFAEPAVRADGVLGARRRRRLARVGLGGAGLRVIGLGSVGLRGARVIGAGLSVAGFATIADPVARHHVDQACLGKQGLRRQVERVGDLPEHAHRRLVQAALDLAQVRVRQAGQLRELTE
jgi:methylenetetrahydrofolate dehydrogenase (NADP+) / methenyltetrahydrofolate cyclohydrolase